MPELSRAEGRSYVVTRWRREIGREIGRKAGEEVLSEEQEWAAYLEEMLFKRYVLVSYHLRDTTVGLYPASSRECTFRYDASINEGMGYRG
jgi:hypothetical protein